MKRIYFAFGICLIIGAWWIIMMSGYSIINGQKVSKRICPKVETCNSFAPKFVLNPTNVFAQIMRYDIKFSEIVLRQALLESGHFKSHNCKTRNNIFGFKGGIKTTDNTNGYATYNNWMESVEAYSVWQQERLTSDVNDYYLFLERMGYHQSEDYKKKCESIRLIIVLTTNNENK